MPTDPYDILPGSDASRRSDDPHGAQIDLPPTDASALADGVWCPLPDHGLLVASGADRVSFLQAQLTNDVASMAPQAARWNGYCSPKGRLLATFLAWNDDDAIALATSRPLVEGLRKRLSMFVLRSKARLEDQSDQRCAIGLLGRDVSSMLVRLGIELDGRSMAVARATGLVAIRLSPLGMRSPGIEAQGPGSVDLPAADVQPAQAQRSPLPDPGHLDRVMVWGTVDAMRDALSTLPAGAAAATSLWRWAEIRAAVPRIFPATAEHFVPQMVNLELVGGVSFDKGCYPGQEVVARSQYLGKLKRRMFVGHSAAALPPGTEVHDAGGARAVGEVVMSARSPYGGFDCLFEAQTDAVRVGEPLAADGGVLEPGVLPYPIPDATPVRRVL